MCDSTVSVISISLLPPSELSCTIPMVIIVLITPVFTLQLHIKMAAVKRAYWPRMRPVFSHLTYEYTRVVSLSQVTVVKDSTAAADGYSLSQAFC